MNTKKSIILLLLLFSLFYISDAQKVDVYKRPFKYERSRDYDAKHYRIALAFDLDNKYFSGENRITLTPLKDGFKECVLDAEELIANGVTDSRNQPLRFKQTDKYLIVTFRKFTATEKH